jgi:hypothetical protein
VRRFFSFRGEDAVNGLRALGITAGVAAGEYPHQGCGSGMFIPDPDFLPSRIQYKKEVVIFHKIENIFLTGTEKDFSQLTQNLSICNPKYCY